VEPSENREALVTSLTYLCLASDLALLEKNADSKAIKERIVAKKLTAFNEVFGDKVKTSRYELLATLNRQEIPFLSAQSLTIDMCGCNPFAPYEVKFDNDDLKKSIISVATHLGLMQVQAQKLVDAYDETTSELAESWWPKALVVIGAAAALAAGGWVLAPLLGGLLGAGAGLAGAAAVSHGLALLGGGSLALGGFGMAGGLWLITGAGAVVGLTVGSGVASALIGMGSEAAKREMAKAMVAFREVTLVDPEDEDNSAACKSVGDLLTSLNKIQERIDDEKLLNDSNSQRLKDMQSVYNTMKKAIDWMQNQLYGR
jgi:hypothetical protein